jgi:hypothetical protein
MRIWWHKFTHWEYWSVNIVYLPTFFLWIWYMIKFRSFSFYKYSNPSIKNGGFYGDSKMEIYNLLTAGLYPRTALIQKNEVSNFEKIVTENKIKYPFIVKPDIGLRGIDVQKVNTIDELIQYGKKAKGNFLIQELIDLPNEIGLFYCRLPSESNGKITGITLKKFLTVTGNGIDNIEQLMKKNLRFEMQTAKIINKINLNEVIPKHEKRCLVPFGNHNRGTEFLDGKEYITEKLEFTFDNILTQIPGFYYGRLDIRFNTFEELEQGVNFSIIELNGAKSEPTHIYDTKHSFWYGQREIFRHQKIFGKIIKINMYSN